MNIIIHIDNEAGIVNKKTGIGYFTSELIYAIKKNSNYEIDEYVIGGKSKLLNKIYKISRHLGFELPLKLSVGLKNNDVVIGANYLIPKSAKTINIPVVYDLCFIDHPEWVQVRNAKILRLMLPKTLKRSEGIITISDFSASRIRELYNYEKPILVIGIPAKKSDAGLLVPNKIENKKNFFLFVSTIEPRKNVNTLLDAYETLPENIQEKHSLILAGKPGWDEKALRRLRLNSNKNIIYLEYVNEAEKNWLYKNALATVVPSHYEGFGMMTLESLDANTPVITSDIPPQREILGSSGQYFEPADILKLSGLMLDITDPKKREGVLVEQSKILKKYSWDKTAHEVVNFCEEISGK